MIRVGSVDDHRATRCAVQRLEIDDHVGRHAAEDAQLAIAERDRGRGGNVAARRDVEVRCCRRQDHGRARAREHADETAARRIGGGHVDGRGCGRRIGAGNAATSTVSNWPARQAILRGLQRLRLARAGYQ